MIRPNYLFSIFCFNANEHNTRSYIYANYSDRSVGSVKGNKFKVDYE